MPIELREVKSESDLKKFVKFAYSHYRGDKYWIPPLINGEIETLSRKTNPSIESCDTRYLMAFRDGVMVGRIAGIINHRFIEIWEKKYARFCWFDFIDDLEVSGALLNDIEKWAKTKGMDALLGPMGFSTFERQGILIEGFDVLPTFASNYNWPYYPEHLEKLGYGKEHDYVEYEVKTPAELPDKVLKIRDLIMKRYKLKALKAKKTKELLPYARQVFEVMNAAYKPLHGYVELTEKQIDYFVKKYFTFIRAEYVSAILNEEDKMVGFIIAIPNLSRAFQKAGGRLFPFGLFHLMKALKNPDRVDMMLVGIHPDYQGKGLNSIFMTNLLEVFHREGVKWIESNNELEDNVKVQNNWRHFEHRQIKRSRVFIKRLV